MVATNTESIKKQATTSRFIYVTGCDGTGKTTQAELLIDRLREKGLSIRHLWLRFPFFFSVPFLAYARLSGRSWYEEKDGVKQGFWNFRNSWLLRLVYPWVLLLDTTLFSITKVYLPLRRGHTIVCERFVLDMLVDLAVAFGDPGFHKKLPGRLFVRLLPKEAHIVILDLDIDTLRSRRADLKIDRHLPDRLEAFRQLAKDRSLTVLSSSRPIEEVNMQIQGINGTGEEVNSQTQEINDSGEVKQKIRGYGKGKPGFLQPLMRYPVFAVMLHWLVQGLLNMDRTERWFKLGLDALLTLSGFALFKRRWPWQYALPGAFLLAHTLNFLFNGQLFALLKNFGYVKHSFEEFRSYVQGLERRALQESAIRRIAVFGSLSRNAWSPSSDLDACIIRKPGLWNGLRACWFLVKERTLALIHRFPLDMYVLDDEGSLDKRRSSDEQPFMIASKEETARDEEHSNRYPPNAAGHVKKFLKILPEQVLENNSWKTTFQFRNDIDPVDPEAHGSPELFSEPEPVQPSLSNQPDTPSAMSSIFQAWVASNSNTSVRIVNVPFWIELNAEQAFRGLKNVNLRALAEKVLPLGAFITSATWATIASVSLNEGFQDSWLLEGLVLPLFFLILSYILNIVRSKDLRRDAIFTAITVFLYYTLPTIKYAAVYASTIDSGVHISMMRALALNGFPDSNYYRYTPAMHMLIASISQLSGLSVEVTSKLLPGFIGAMVPICAYMMINRIGFPPVLGKMILFFSGLSLSLFYMPNGTSYSSLFMAHLFFMVVISANEPKRSPRYLPFLLIVLILLAMATIVHSISSLLIPSVMAGTGGLTLLVTRVLRRFDRERVWLRNLGKAFLRFGLIGLFFTLTYWLTLAGPIWREFVDHAHEFLQVVLGMERASGVLVPQKTFTLSTFELLSVFSFYHARDAVLSLLVLVAILLGLWSFRKKQEPAHIFQLVNVLTASYLSFSLILVGAFLAHYSAFGYQRLMLYIVTISPVLAGFAFWRITEELHRWLKFAPREVIWTVGMLLTFLICTIQIYPYQPGVPQVEVDGTGEKTPIYWHHRVNTEYQRRMIEFAFYSMPGDLSLYADYTGYQQVAIFINANAKDRFRYGNWEEPVSSYVLFHKPGIGGGFAEQAEFRSTRAISRLRNLPGVSTVYDNEGSFILFVPQHLIYNYDLSRQP